MVKDYCQRCQEDIDQIDLGDGEFGCPTCRLSDAIITHYEGDDEI